MNCTRKSTFAFDMDGNPVDHVHIDPPGYVMVWIIGTNLAALTLILIAVVVLW